MARDALAPIAVRLTLLLIMIFFPGRETAGQNRADVLAAKTYRSPAGRTMPYRLFVPAPLEKGRSYPLVVFLHGGGGRGDDNLKQIEGGNGFLIDLVTRPESQALYPCLVVAPQSPSREGWIEYDSITPTSQLQLVLELIDTLEKSYNVDPQRLYVMGQSMGGFGSFAVVTMRPSMFAAFVPISGGGDPTKAGAIARVPMWAFHGDEDAAVEVERSRRMVSAMTAAGGKPRYSEYKGEGHLIWSKVVREQELLPWMFAQRRGDRP
jgi:predicted peptidase